MPWSVDRIEKEWIKGPITALAVEPDEAVAAFGRVEDLLGLPWLEQARISDGCVLFGPAPTINVISMGKRLAALDGISSADKLIKKIRNGDTSAVAEIAAIHIVRRTEDVRVELEPKVGTRVPDFRVRNKDEAWTYVEVTFPNWSETTKHATRVLESVASLVLQIKTSFALEVFLRREPNEAELAGILTTVPVFCSRQGKCRAELPDNLGFLMLNGNTPGLVITDDYGEELRPRIGVAKAISGQAEPHRHIAVRMAYSDQRATAFLDSEAVQLSEDAPGLIIIATGRAPGSMKDWEALLAKQFALELHTQASGICLFSRGVLTTPKGVAALLQTKLFVNATAKFLLPEWLTAALLDAGAEYEHMSKQKYQDM